MKRALSILLAVITLLSIVPMTAVPAMAASTPEEAMTKARIYAVGDSVSYLLYDGDPKGVTPAYYTGRSLDGEAIEYPAYCINPHKPGPSERGAYSVDTKDYINDPKIWGIVSNGYPYKTIGELGVYTREQAFYATKMALWTYINNWNVNLWTAANGEQNVTLAALKKIYSAGMAVTSIEQPMLSATADKPKMELDAINPNFASQTFTVTANMEIKSYEVFLKGEAPDGTKITDINNNPKTVFTSGEKFKVLIPANQIQNATGSFEIGVVGQLKTNAVIYGMSYDTGLQDFSITRDPFSFEDAAANVVYSTQTTFLEIIKLAAGTNSPLAGAVFKVTDSEGGVVGTFTTDSSGRVIVPLTKSGAFQVEELTPPSGFTLDVNAHKDVVVKWEQTTTATFTNEKEPSLSVRKIDADTGGGIENAVIRIAKEGGMAFTDVKTGAGGWAYVTLPPGVYSVTEIAVPEPFKLDPTPQTIILEAGKTATITLQNHKKPGLIIWKYDEDTALPLGGAEFSVAKKGGSIVYEGVTPASGMLHIENLEPNQWYTVTELASPKGYLKATESKDVFLEPGKTVEIKFDNRLRPALRIVKLDSQTNEPLAGAKFKVQKTEDATVSEYITDATGTITIYDLDEAVYSVWEYEAPANHLLDPQHKDIKLEWGKTKTLVFTNKAKPALRILKVDAVTGQPLQNAEFRVTKVEDATVSEYITGASGEILIKNLDESVYRATEFMPPDGYLLYTESKEIMLEWGQTKTLKFDNIRKPVAVFLKTNALTGKGIPGATFKVEYETPGGGLKNLGSYKTGADGRIIIPKAEPGWYVYTETLPAPGFSLPKNPVTRMYFAPGDNAYLAEFEHYYTGGTGDTLLSAPSVVSGQVEEHSGSEYYVEGEGYNWPLNSIVIKKTHAITGELLAGAAFELYRADEQVSGVPGTAIGRYTTDNSGVVVITGLEPGYYVCKEVQAPQNFLISENSQQNGFLKPDGTTVLEFTFANYPYGSLLISKVDALTGTPLSGARFKVTDSSGAVIGNSNGEYVTDSRGEILIPNVKPGAVVVTEVQAPANYAIITTPKTVQIGTDGKTYKVTFENSPYGQIIIRKMDTATREPLAGVEFKVTTSTGAVVDTGNGIFTTDAQGIITIPNLPKGSYVITETKTLSTHILENQTRTIAVDYGQTYTLDFYNQHKSGLQIIKIDADTKQPLKGAMFTVYKKSGDLIGEYETNGDGIIILDNLSPGWVKIVESRSPDGFLRDDTPRDVEITANQFVKVVFENKRIGSLQIKKVNEQDGSPLAGATFTVTKQNGEYVGEYTTGADGLISIAVEPSWLVVTEKKAPSGFILDSTPKIVEVKAAIPTVVTFTNKPESGLQIKKINSETRQPIEGVEFTIAKLSGERVGTYKTDKSGLIYLTLEPGQYTVTEVKNDGYILDAAPRTVEITWGKPVVLEIENTPMSGLLIVKTDEKTGKPLKGVVFDVMRADGQRVAGYITDGNQPDTEANSPNRTTSPNGDISGSYTTDANGRILINTLPAGEYHIVERRALDGYELDTDVHSATVTPGKLTTLQLTNRQKAGLRLVKIDSITKKPIYNVEFMIFDANNKVVGTYYTDNNGVIDFSGILTEGRYTLRETRPASNYYPDDVPRTVEFRAGQVTEVRWENTPKLGQIQIIKKSGDDNEVNGLPAGTPLAGAIFEAYEYKSGNLVDRFVSGSDGRAVSKPLPLGRYLIKEVQSPQWYKLSTQTLDIEIEFATQIVKHEFLNYSANTGVNIRKTGPVECMPGDTIRYDIKAVQNTSTVPLTDFYWRDSLPTDAVRLTRLVTGTYNQSLKYKVMITTNKGDSRVIADNLSTTKNNVIDCSNAALGLKNDEYITSVTLVFGTVKAGFCQVEQPQIYVKVLDTLQNGYQFANKADVGGKYGREWVVGNTTWLTTVYKKPVPLPRTGY